MNGFDLGYIAQMSNGWPMFNEPEKAESGHPAWGAPPVNAGVPSQPPAPEVVQAPRMPSPRLKLSTVAHCKREIARIYREARRGEIPVDKASKLVNMLQIQSRLIVDHELESRVEQLEGSTGK